MIMKEKILALERQIEELRRERITQARILPDVIKQRAMGEGIRFIRGGASGDKPTLGEEPPFSSAIYFDETNNKLWVWNTTSSSWVSTTLS